MTDLAEQTLMKNEVYADLFNDYMQERMPNFFKNWSVISLDIAKLARLFVI